MSITVTEKNKILDRIERESGYREAMEEAGLTVDDNYIIEVEPFLEGGAEAANILLSRNLKYTAVACYNDTIAIGLMAELHNHGINVPDDVSIVGFDDLFLSRCLNPPLTTIYHPISLMSRSAVNLSNSLYQGNNYDLPEFRLELIKRNSVKRI